MGRDKPCAPPQLGAQLQEVLGANSPGQSRCWGWWETVSHSPHLPCTWMRMLNPSPLCFYDSKVRWSYDTSSVRAEPPSHFNSCWSAVTFTCPSKKSSRLFSFDYPFIKHKHPAPVPLHLPFLFFFSWLPHNKNVSLILILLLRQSKPSLLGMPYKSQKRRDSIMQDFI